jgi:hypothetical protein
MRLQTVLTYIAAILIVLALGALAGWYFFLRSATRLTSASDVARGFSESIPSFSGGTGSTYQNMTAGISDAAQRSRAKNALPQFWHVTTSPVAGFGFVLASGSSTNLHFAERATGYVFAADQITQSLTRLTNTLMPKTYEAFFSLHGRIIERSLDADQNITTFVGVRATSTAQGSAASSTPDRLVGVYWPTIVDRLAINPLSGQIFSLIKDGAGNIAGVQTSSADGSKQKILFASSITGWLPTTLPDGRVFLLEAPADDIVGHAYELKQDGSFALVAPGRPGLTILPRNASSAILYGTSAAGDIALYARVTGSSTPLRLPIRTIADKCVWAPGKSLIAYCAVPASIPTGTYLTDWYRGVVHTDDSWWRVDVSAGTAELLPFAQPSSTFDVDSPTIDDTGTFIAFRDAHDLSLWIARINK